MHITATYMQVLLHLACTAVLHDELNIKLNIIVAVKLCGHRYLCDILCVLNQIVEHSLMHCNAINWIVVSDM